MTATARSPWPAISQVCQRSLPSLMYVAVPVFAMIGPPGVPASADAVSYTHLTLLTSDLV